MKSATTEFTVLRGGHGFLRQVVAAIAALTMLGARSPMHARVPLQGAPSSGQAAFDRVCKVCHGPEARGDAGPRLVPFSRDDEELLGIVREGIGQMPPISARELPDESVPQIAAYLRSLSRPVEKSPLHGE
jgi:mono/diheme cytochrome c family protein